MNEELKPCPFCGGKAFALIDGPDDHVVTCIECDAQVAWQDCASDAIAAWNRRTPEPPQ